MSRLRRRRLLGVFAVSSLAALAACTGGGGDDDAATTTRARDGGATTDAAGATDATAVATAWLASSSGLDEGLIAELGEPTEVDSAGVTHVRFTRTLDGRPVHGGTFVVHVLDDGTVQGADSSLTDAQPARAGDAVDEAAAERIATKAVQGTPVGEVEGTAVWVQSGRELHPGYRFLIAAEEPVGSWSVVVDAVTRAVVDTGHAKPEFGGRGVPRAIGASLPGAPRQAGGADACEAPAAPSACVFMPDPVLSNGGPIGPGEANSQLVGVSLQGLTANDQLKGQYADAAPSDAPVQPEPEADGTWAGGLGSRNFEATMAYYWIDYTQRLMQRLGFDPRADKPTQVLAVFPDEVDNAFFRYVDDRMFLGVSANGINAGQDATVIVHEYGHGVLYTQVGLDVLAAGDVQAYSEAFGDILAVMSTLEFRKGDAACIGSWFLGPDCFRRTDTDKVYPRDLVNEVHGDGELFVGAVWDAFEGLLGAEGLAPADCKGTDRCGAVRDRILKVALTSHGYFVPGVTLVDIANAYLKAVDAADGGKDRGVWEEAFRNHGLAGAGTTSIPPDGGAPTTGAPTTGAPATDSPTSTTGGTSGPGGRTVIADITIDHDYRGDLEVLVGVLDPNFNDLCEAIVLAEPDDGDDGDGLSGRVDLSGTGCAEFAPPSPDHVWAILVTDTVADDEGVLLDFTIEVDGDPYPAGGLPTLIPDGDPSGTAALIDGTGVDVPIEGEDGPDGARAGQPYVTIDVTHEYNGDLMIRAGVADRDGAIQCVVPIQEPDPSDDSAGVAGDVDMSDCAAYWPPAPERQWFLQVVDAYEGDTGTIDAFVLTGPDGSTHSFGDLPTGIPDADEDGVALLFDGSGGSEGTAGGSGQGSDLELPAVQLAFEHGYAGDLAIAAGVADASGNSLCEVAIRLPDPDDDSVDPAGTASVAECADYYPPSPDRRWYVYARDTLEGDEGVLAEFILQGPDGRQYQSDEVPLTVPDADYDGVALFIDGSEAFDTGGDVEGFYVITHPYAGDLFIRVGVADATGTIVCEAVVHQADPNDDTVDPFGDVSFGECSAEWPPAPDRQFFLQAVDTSDFDEGSIDEFVVFGPDGSIYSFDDGPLGIPDNDPNGAVIFVG